MEVTYIRKDIHEKLQKESDKWRAIADKLYEASKENAPRGRWPEYPQYMDKKEKAIKAYEKAKALTKK